MVWASWDSGDFGLEVYLRRLLGNLTAAGAHWMGHVILHNPFPIGQRSSRRCAWPVWEKSYPGDGDFLATAALIN